MARGGDAASGLPSPQGVSAMAGKAWVLISKEAGDRQYGGNVGYADLRRVLYAYDSTVPNHKQLSLGDFVIVRDSRGAFGAAIVESLEQSSGVKVLQRCPSCGTTSIKARKQALPRWRCSNGHAFVAPSEEERPVLRFEARFGESYRDIAPPLSSRTIRAAALRPSDQLSIEEVSLEAIEAALLHACPAARDIVEGFARGLTVNAVDGAPETEPPFAGSIVDSRQMVLRAVLNRRGQVGFRNQLISRYGPKCMITGATLLDVIEAAHIKPYRGQEDNDPANGLLLRADLHTLFDLLLLGIEPDSLKVKLHPRIRGYGYDHLETMALAAGTRRPSTEALRGRWQLFLDRLLSDQGSAPTRELA